MKKNIFLIGCICVLLVGCHTERIDSQEYSNNKETYSYAGTGTSPATLSESNAEILYPEDIADISDGQSIPEEMPDMTGSTDTTDTIGIANITMEELEFLVRSDGEDARRTGIATTMQVEALKRYEAVKNYIKNTYPELENFQIYTYQHEEETEITEFIVLPDKDKPTSCFYVEVSALPDEEYIVTDNFKETVFYLFLKEGNSAYIEQNTDYLMNKLSLTDRDDTYETAKTLCNQGLMDIECLEAVREKDDLVDFWVVDSDNNRFGVTVNVKGALLALYDAHGVPLKI